MKAGPGLRAPAAPALADLQVIAIGALALALAMGVGRFAFTPLLPLMLRDGTLDAATAAEWAALNYAGYLLGALTAARVAARLRRAQQLGLWGVTLTTLGVGLLGAQPLPAAGALLRALAGVCSAWAFVSFSSWCLAELAARARAQRGAWVYTGVGLGIAASGLLCWLGGRQTARALWLELGLITLLGTLWIDIRLRGAAAAPPRAGAPAPAAPAIPAPPPAGASTPSTPRTPASAAAAQRRKLVVCYGSFGFGYIVPATFLPAMARAQVADPLVFGLTWPLFGSAAVLSVALAARWMGAWPRHRVWALAQATMALGTALPLLTPSLWALAASALFVGGTFMVTTMAGLQLAREQAAANPTPLLARMTAAFATGQIAGPAFVRLLGEHAWWGHGALFWANAAATLLLLASAAWLLRGESARTPLP